MFIEILIFHCFNPALDVFSGIKAVSDGQWLFDEVIDRLDGVLEREYFGLRYLDKDKQRVLL